MFGWFLSKPECPIDPVARDWIDARWAWLEAQFGTTRLRNRPMILPRVEFFPGEFNGTPEDARRVLDLVCGFMDIDPATIEMQLFDNGGSGAAGVYEVAGDKFRIWIAFSQLHDALALVSTIAHELGHIHLLGHGRIPEDADDHEPLTDLLTVYFGMGFFSANSIVVETHWTEGHSSSWTVGRKGYLDMPHFGYALAKYARCRDEDGSEWKRDLRLDVRSAFKKALRYLEYRERQGEADSTALETDNTLEIVGEIWTLPRGADDGAIKSLVVEWSERLARGGYVEALAMLDTTGLQRIHSPVILERTIAGYGVAELFDGDEVFAVTTLRGRPDADEIIRDKIRVDRKNIWLDSSKHLGMVHYDDIPLNGERSDLTARFHIVPVGVDRLTLALCDLGPS